MSTLSEPTLPFETARAPRPGLRALCGTLASRVVFWAPVWVPLALLAQVALLGLGPALAESRRLDAERVELDRRLEHENTVGIELERTHRAQNDPIYLERERRLLQAPNGPLRVK